MSDTVIETELGGFSAMLKNALGPLVDQQASGFAEMMADDGVMEFPYAPPGTVKRLDGRTALVTHLAHVNGMIDIRGFSEPVVHLTANPQVVILEFGCDGSMPATGRPYEQQYISVITLRDGKIIRYQDYWNPLVVLEAVGGGEALQAALAQGVAQ